MSVPECALQIRVWKGLFPSLLKHIFKQGSAVAAPSPSSSLLSFECHLALWGFCCL